MRRLATEVRISDNKYNKAHQQRINKNNLPCLNGRKSGTNHTDHAKLGMCEGEPNKAEETVCLIRTLRN